MGALPILCIHISACLYIYYLTESGQTHNLWAECPQQVSQSPTNLVVLNRQVHTLQPGQSTASSSSFSSRLRKNLEEHPFNFLSYKMIRLTFQEAKRLKSHTCSVPVLIWSKEVRSIHSLPMGSGPGYICWVTSRASGRAQK